MQQAPPTEGDAGPLFILGAPRSGTTAMVAAIAALHRFGRFATEGHFIYLIGDALARIVEGRLNPNCVARDRERALAIIRNMLDEMYGGAPWIDKTPGVQQIKVVPALAQLYPGARFIFMYRPVVEAVRSTVAVRKWNQSGKELEIAGRWVACQAAWREVRSHAPRHLEVYQPDMRERPEIVAAGLGGLLGLSTQEEESVVAFWRRNEKLSRPKTGEAADAYDAAVVAPQTQAAILTAAADEARHWARLN